MDFDALAGAGSGGVIGGIVAKIIAYFESRDLNEKFKHVDDTMNAISREITRHQAKVEAVEKAHDNSVKEIRETSARMDEKIDALLTAVYRMEGQLRK